MKRLLQLVAYAVVALFAVPPALAASICTVASSQPGSMECCDVDHVSAFNMLPDVVRDCDEGCCSVGPQNSPAPVVPNKFKSDSTGLDAPVAIASLMMHCVSDGTARAVVATGRAQDLPVLLHTFRI